MDAHFWLLFIATLIGVSIIPGPSTLIAFTHGARFGSSKALFTAGGNGVASSLQALAASAGLGVVITTSATLFLIIKYIGAAYLVYMGIQMWRHAGESSPTPKETDTPNALLQTKPKRRLFSSGFLVAASNPKAIVFFTALFPQFLSTSGNSVSQLSAMVLIVGIEAFVVAATYGLIGGWAGNLKVSSKLATRLNKATGGLFMACGVGLASTHD